VADQVRVFVSHHHSPEEDAFTARLVVDLEAAGADVWVDDARITSDDFIKKINEGLTGRQWLVLVMTPDALQSPWVQSEVNAALLQVRQGRMLGVIPLVAQPCNDADIPPLWATLNRYDAARGYETARDGLLRAMGLPPIGLSPTGQRTGGVTSPPNPSAASVIPYGPPSYLPQRLWDLDLRGMHFPSNGMELIVPPVCDVPAGPFLMGSDPKKDTQADTDRELPQRSVSLKAYQIAKYPVTVAEYDCFVRAIGHPEPKSPYNQLTWAQQREERLDHPVVNVSWHDAVAYTAWLAEQTGQPWRLPTEAEWEKAARGIDGRLYPWGNRWFVANANTSPGKKGSATPVGAYPNSASSYGVLDMVGNVWEWTSTIFKPYPYVATDGREEAESSGPRVLRGCSWGDAARNARVAYRTYFDMSVVIAYDGFRLARSIPNS
jgi:formylglycine-generating enzyme required for sulfatase activity